MKRILSILLMLCCMQTWAQVSDAWKNEIESIFQHVNRTPVTTGLLTDYGIYFTNIDKFNGIPSDTNYIELTELQSLYLSLYTCRFNINATIPEPVTVFDLVDTLGIQHSGIILITGLHLNYERFKDNAVPSLVYVSNNKIYDTPGRPTTPYEIKDAFALAPTRNWLKGGSHQFMFKPELFVSNTGKTVASLQVDFNDGQGYQTLQANVPVNVYYTTEDEKVLKFKLTYTDASFRESRTKFFVDEIPDIQARYGGLNVDTFDFPLTGFPAPKAYQGQVAGARVTVEYTNPQREIRRPLIVVEGFDGWNILTPGDPEQNYSFEDFISRRNGIDQLINYTHNGTHYATLSDALEGEDFDLIFIDFDDGTDYIQRNAYLVENIIEWVNSVKEPYNGVMQQNVVIGFSMGGLVARYALRDMELDNKTHDTRLYCSFDSPHQGANIPVGFQAAVSHLSGIGIGFGLPGITYSPASLTLGRLMPELGRAHRLLNRPAARQMLRYSVVGSGHFIFHNNSIHETFMNEYHNTLGYPQQGGIRNIVLASGSECGTDQGFAPHAEFINFSESFKLKYWINLVGNLLSPLALLTTYPQLAIGGNILTTRTDVKAQFIVNALPDQSAQRVYKGKLWVKRKILFVINTNTTLFDKEFHSLASYLPLDNNSGGIYDIAAFEIPAAFADMFSITRFSFIPTFSALDVGGGQQSITLNDITRSYSPSAPPAAPKNVVAANFFSNPTEAGFSNQIHTRITLRNGRWLFQEIIGQPAFFSCAYVCADPSIGATIAGTDVLCTTNSGFTLNNPPTGASITWAATPAGLFATTGGASSSGDGTTAALRAATTSTTGQGSITFTIPGGCGVLPITKNVWVGTRKPTGFISVVVDPWLGRIKAMVDPVPDASGYQWYRDGILYTGPGQNSDYVTMPIPRNNCSIMNYSVGVKAMNACGISATYSEIHFNPCYQGGFYYSYFPNPASEILTIEKSSLISTEISQLSLTINEKIQNNHSYKLYDLATNSVVFEGILFDKTEIDVIGLNKGRYLLKISIDKDKEESHHIIIN